MNSIFKNICIRIIFTPPSFWPALFPHLGKSRFDRCRAGRQGLVARRRPGSSRYRRRHRDTEKGFLHPDSGRSGRQRPENIRGHVHLRRKQRRKGLGRDLVQVDGTVTEFRPRTERIFLSITEITKPTVKVISKDNPLPAPIALTPPNSIRKENSTRWNVLKECGSRAILSSSAHKWIYERKDWNLDLKRRIFCGFAGNAAAFPRARPRDFADHRR